MIHVITMSSQQPPATLRLAPLSLSGKDSEWVQSGWTCLTFVFALGLPNVRPLSDVCWFRFAPVTIVISIP